MTFQSRPVAATTYGFVGPAAVRVTAGNGNRLVGGTQTHWADLGSGVGSVQVRFTAVPATDGPDPGGLGGIGTVRGSVIGQLAPFPGPTGTAVTLSGTFL